ncbi:hypothetical protein [Enterobacter hormaechei]|uniref:hypothetical protein n=1 Tax=Enterobacter hormaechei TaxID=158836 RepID=UPI00125B1992|nr:hypothetical protein [Enterobacter hormaechei]QLO96162.1 hypothetical protein HV047_10100 [Enterobacter hormaechei]VAM35024.1 type VI secretion ATPase, ClpV1 family [Enterobacter hormaechei]
MENPAILLRRLNPYCARAMEGAASLCQTRAHAEILPEHWLLNQQVLPVLSQQLLSHMAAGQKPHALTLGWDEEEGVMIELRQEDE